MITVFQVGLRPALALLALLSLAACGRTEANLPERKDAHQPIPVAIAPAIERMLPSTLEITGTLVADAQTEIAAELEYRVIEVLAERGQRVIAGQVIARLDSEDPRNILAEAEATEAQIRERLGLGQHPGQSFDPARTPEVRQAVVVMERAEADYRRFVQLMDEGAISRSEHDLKRAEYLAAKEQVETLKNQMRQLYQTLQAQKARVAAARRMLEETVIRAPFAGQIAERHVNVGRFMKKGERIATLVRTDPLRIELSVPEGAVGAIRQGQRVSFAVQSHPGRRFEGTIAYVGPALKADARALVVEAVVPNSQGLLQPGLFATASVELPASQPSVMIPAAAVLKDDRVFKVFVSQGDRAELRIVQVGRESGGFVEILRGIRPGEPVIAKAAEGLADGAPITAIP
jgi:RND family efflux transporter MFP subunit